MSYTIQEARLLVIAAGLRLLETGLIARTWGNLSARISDTQFVVTPSGLAYHTLRPEQLVLVNIADCSYEGSVKPSSEKGIHADAYRLRPSVNFVIHTHQAAASVCSVLGEDIPQAGALLGECIPCAAYGLAGTKALRKAVSSTVARCPSSPAVLLRHHGALCMGADDTHAFQVVEALEESCAKLIPPAQAAACLPLGNSERHGDAFILRLQGTECLCPLSGTHSGPAAIHAAIYASCNAQFILQESSPSLAALCSSSSPIRPLLDDLVQIAGVSIRLAENTPQAVSRALRGRDAVLVQGAGALCLGKTQEDAEAICILLRKDADARRYAQHKGSSASISRLHAQLERQFYLKKYSKRKA